MKKQCILLLTLISFISCGKTEDSNQSIMSQTETQKKQYPKPKFSLEDANKLLELPLDCVGTEYPNKLQQTLGGEEDLKSPMALHPIFYGCFDWHSSVHGYWTMVSLLQNFPEMDKSEDLKQFLRNRITSENVRVEVNYFEREINKTFERTYGWAWFLKLAETFHNWDDPFAREMEETLQPLTDILVLRFKEFLPKLNYPVRVGEHANTAFALSFAYDYANSINDGEFKNLLKSRAVDFYMKDQNCPISWEPSGYDFFSPCLEEIGIMQRVLESDEFLEWLDHFMPQLSSSEYSLKPGEVSDRTDGKLVHLDGLNFSRAWILYDLAYKFEKYAHLENTANEHMLYSYPNVIGDSYEGGHWLASFAVYAMNTLYHK